LPASTAADLTLERHKFTENIHTLGSPSCKLRASQYPSADSERTARHGQCRGRIAVAQSVGRQKNLAAQWQSWSRMISLWPAAGRPVSAKRRIASNKSIYLCYGPSLSGLFHSIHRDVESARRFFRPALDIRRGCSKITNGSGLPKSVEPCRGIHSRV